jgi:asparagine synthase (glutamine-hydrolysing)
MCGIAGILRIHPPGQPAPKPWDAIPEHWLDILDDSIKHRGPDGAGRFRDRAMRVDGSTVDVALVHRRLSIIDHAGGHQPMVSLAKGEGVVPVRTFSLGEGLGLYEPGDYEILRAHQRLTPHASTPSSSDLVAVVFNGCIYNHRELRKELQAAGHVFSTDHSDTEVLVHGWREWRDKLQGRLDGMFAFGVWNRAGASLTLARDSFGEKPIYQLKSGGIVCFSTSAAGLIRLLGAGCPAADPADAEERLRCMSPWIKYGWNQSNTPVPGVVEQPLPGFFDHYSAEVRSMQATDNAWPSYDALNPSGKVLTPEKVDAELRQALCTRLDADVPIGCFLSGGVDSSLIAAHAHQLRPDITAFTVRMPFAGLDESAQARRIAGHLGIRHQILECDPHASNDLVALIHQIGLPFGDSSLLPTTWVSRAARQAVRVALAGDGGDELFLGYDRHRALKWFDWLYRLPQGARDAIAEALPHAGHRRSRLSRVARLANAAASSGYKELVAIFPSPLDRDLGIQDKPSWHWGMTTFDPSAHVMTSIRFDRLFYLPYDLLRKTDTASMSVALEVRCPMLAPCVARPAMNAPVENLMPHNQRKGLLRQVARKYFPAEIVDRPKMGFAIPIGEWFRSNYGGMRDLLLDHLNSAEPFGPPSLGIDLSMTFIRQMLAEHDRAGEKSLFPWKGRDHSQRLYMLLVLSIWAKWLGSLGPAARH